MTYSLTTTTKNVSRETLTPSTIVELFADAIAYQFSEDESHEFAILPGVVLYVTKTDTGSFPGDMIDPPEDHFSFFATITKNGAELLEFGGTEEEWDEDSEGIDEELVASLIRPEGVRVGGHDVPQSVVDEMARAPYGCPLYDPADWIAGRNRIHATTGDRLAHTNGSTFTWENDYGHRWIVSAFDNSDTMLAPKGQRYSVHYFVDYSR